MKPHQLLGFFALILIAVHFEPSLASPLPRRSSPTNTSVEYDIFGMSTYKEPNMNQLLEKNPIFLRDTVSTKFVEFDIPRGATGLYPVVITFSTTTKLSFLSINSTSNLSVSLVKCGKVIRFGKITRAHILFNQTSVEQLDKEDCGKRWKNNYIKLVLTPDNKRAQGYARIDGQYYSIEGTESFYALIGLAIGIAVIVVVFLTSICIKCKKTTPTVPREWPQSQSFDYRQNRGGYIPPEPQPLPMYPLRRTESEVTVFEHEREEMALALQQEREATFRQQNDAMLRQYFETMARLRALDQQERLEASMFSGTTGEYVATDYEDIDEHPDF